MGKFKQTIFTTKGKQILFGGGMVTYTRAGLSTTDLSKFSTDQLEGLTSVDVSMFANVGVSKIDHDIQIKANFVNQGLKDDLDFASVAWFAKAGDGAESLLAVSPIDGTKTLAAGSPDGTTDAFNLTLSIAVGDATNVTVKLNPIDIVRPSDLDSLKATLDDQIKKNDDKTQKALATKANSSDVYTKADTFSGGVNLFRNTDKLDKFWKPSVDNNGSVDNSANYASDVNHELIATKNVFHIWGSKASDAGIKNTQRIYFEPGIYTISFLARNNGTDRPSFNLSLYSDYSDPRGGVTLGSTSTNLTNIWQRYSITFKIDQAGTYGNWRLVNWSDAQLPGGSLFFANLARAWACCYRLVS